MQLAPINLFSLYYEPGHVRNQDIFIIRKIFRTLEYSKVRRHLNPCQTYCKVFRKKFQAVIIFAERFFLDHIRCLAGFLNVPIYLQMLLGLYSLFRFYFRHIQTYSSIIREHTHAYTEPCVYLAYLGPWYIPITKHIQTPWYTHNTILNFFAKAPS